MSSDFIYIPSSIAFYLIMSFMPIMTIIMFIYSIPGFKEFISTGDRDPIAEVLGKFIPGMRDIISQIGEAVSGWTTNLGTALPFCFS
ncbi:hypothetical protein [Mycoplasma sp. ATU-Cv-508]|uniref:hypothetical protein n=1 Tax=Mycoplasma sp. ATU-Cv-508 TaxID=2048001 RepID=UPI000FDEA4FD